MAAVDHDWPGVVRLTNSEMNTLGAVADGARTVRGCVAVTGHSTSTTHSALRRLARLGVVTYPPGKKGAVSLRIPMPNLVPAPARRRRSRVS